MRLIVSIHELVKLFSRKGRKFYFFLCRTAGYMPTSVSLFRTAFIHKSIGSKRRGAGSCGDNERLEYLGDAVLEAVVSDILYHRFPDHDEGYLSKLRSNMVCRARLNAIAFEIGLDEHITLSSRKDLAISHIPGDALEAFVAAIYLDGGIRRVRKFVQRHITNDRRTAEAQGEMWQDNYKSRLVNMGEQVGVEVFFETHRQSGKVFPDAEDNFVSQIKVADVVIGRAKGRSKKQAEQKAACAVLNGISGGQIDILECASLSGERKADSPAEASGVEREVEGSEADLVPNETVSLIVSGEQGFDVARTEGEGGGGLEDSEAEMLRELGSPADSDTFAAKPEA